MRSRPQIAPLFACLLALPLSFVILAFSETFSVPAEAYLNQSGLRMAVLRHAIQSGVSVLTFTSVILAVLGLTYILPNRKRYIGISSRAICAIVLSYQLYAVLGTYRPFREYPPVIMAFLLLALALTVAYQLMGSINKKGGALVRVLKWGLPILSLIGAVVIYAVNYVVFKGLYPSLHLCCLYLTYVLLHYGIAGLIMCLWPHSVTFQRLAAVGVILVPCAVFIGTTTVSTQLMTISEPLYGSFSTLALSKVIKKKYRMSSENKYKVEIPPDEDAERRFVEHAHFPKLPDEFLLDEYNVLLITVESLRFDQTSFADPKLGTTPNLQELANRGATVFTRAYSPSSGTVHTLAGMMTMTYPSLAPVNTWGKAWHGRLRKKATTVAELFQDSGYETIRVNHSFYGCFRNRMLGFGQGFTHSSFVEEWKKDTDTDQKISDIFIRALDARVHSDKRFFSWLFFSSPHSKYVSRYADMPDETEMERYRHEIRYTDEQLGRVISKLDHTGLLEKTIVIFTGDHGEEFGEHGGNHHKSTVYNEVTNVPLVVWIPGVSGESITKPVSTLYPFPYLMLHGSDLFRSQALKVLREEIGPMLRATNGAVIVELVGHDRMLTSLVRS